MCLSKVNRPINIIARDFSRAIMFIGLSSVCEVYGKSESELSWIDRIVWEREVVFGEPSLIQMAAHHEKSYFIQLAGKIDIRIDEISHFYRIGAL